MKRGLAALVAVLVIAAGGAAAWRAGWLARTGSILTSSRDSRRTAHSPLLPMGAPGGRPGMPPHSTQPDAGQSGSLTPPTGAPDVPPLVNVLALDLGGHVESVTSEASPDKWAAFHVLDRHPETGWDARSPVTFPQELVFSFAGRQAVLISGVAFRFGAGIAQYHSGFVKDVEIWTSMDSATSGFVKQGELALSTEDADQMLQLGAVETRYLKVRALSNQGATTDAILGKVKAIEAQRPGYKSLLTRDPELVAFLQARASSRVPAGDTKSSVDAIAASDRPARPDPVAVRKPAHPESRKVLVVARINPGSLPDYAPTEYKPADAGPVDSAIYSRLTFTRVRPQDAWPAMLAPADGIDTVVLAQICDVGTAVPEPFKVALMAWVAEGHKLIVQDADLCGPDALPDYSFIPFRFATSNPGRHGSAGDKVRFVEENTIASANPGDPGFLDVTRWAATPSVNQFGDSNLIKEYDAHWCGHLFGTNLLHASGFVEAYAHHGRGLIVYDGFDVDQRAGLEYRQLVTRELAQPFDPDGLPCSVRLGDFIITTEDRLKSQWMVPGRSYAYPLTLLSNQGYKGTVSLSVTADPPDPTVTASLSVKSVDLAETAEVALSVTTRATSPNTSRTFTVTGKDAAGKSNLLKLVLNERRSGGIRVVSSFPRPQKPTRNLEIILDLSGSMKLPLGTSTRIKTARQVLRTMLAKVPDDFNVGLRFYGHRYGSRQKETCTDTELVVPIQKLDRARLLALVDRTEPRGETPLVYSVLQTPADLKALGGGSVVLITDGEESCNGDATAAARQLKQSGLDVTLNIVGFTLTGKETEHQLGALAEATGGRYYSAQSGDALARALMMAAVEKFPYTVFDAAGRQVATGEAGQKSIELPAGDYRVVVRAAEEDLVADHMTVTPGSDVIAKIVLKGDRFAIER